MTRLEAAEADAGERIDVFLASRVENLSRSAAQRLIENGAVKMTAPKIKAIIKSHRVTMGERFDFELPEPDVTDVLAQNIPLDIVFEDSDLIVINKRKGMVVHPAPGHSDGTLVNALVAHCGDSLSGIGGVRRPGIVHRIDKDTSGLIAAAKNDFAHLKLSQQLRDHSLARVYECVVIGGMKDDCGVVDAPIGRDTKNRKRNAVTDKHSRPAVTHYEVIERYQGYTHLRCRLETGRTHQIRVHLGFIGHPILGDTLYGRKKPVSGLEGQCLHARELTFAHPRTGERITVTTQLPDYFAAVLNQMTN